MFLPSHKFWYIAQVINIENTVLHEVSGRLERSFLPIELCALELIKLFVRISLDLGDIFYLY